jgi:hypothetical protein
MKKGLPVHHLQAFDNYGGPCRGRTYDKRVKFLKYTRPWQAIIKLSLKIAIAAHVGL